jgi:hypothetical protein
MGITRFNQWEDPSPVIGKADFEWFYSGTLQINDDNKIPVKSKSIDVYINKLEVLLYSAAVDSDVTNGAVVVKFYKNAVLIDQVRVVGGAVQASTTIARTLVTAGDRMTASITRVGTTNYGITASMYARVTT